jgi:hypothetical protein
MYIGPMYGGCCNDCLCPQFSFPQIAFPPPASSFLVDLPHARHNAWLFCSRWLGSQVTYRYGGHSMSDPGTSYRTREEIKKMKESSDPIQGLKIRALENNLLTEDDFKACIPWWLCGNLRP